MYIEQLQKFKPNLYLYLPIPVLFSSLMVYNYFATQGVDANKLIQQMIDLVGTNGAFLMLVGPLAFALLIILIYNKMFQNNSVRLLTTSRSSIDWKRFFFSFSIWGLFTVVSTIISFYAIPEDFVWNFKPVKFAVFLILAIIVIPMQTSFEEYLFRAHIMQGLGLATKTRWIPLLVTSFLFGIMHIGNPEVDKLGPIVMIYYIGTGLFLGILTLMDEGLELALGFHAANNLIGALLVTSDWTAFQTHSVLKDVAEPQVGIQILMPVLIIFPILIFVFAKKYNWNNWKEKLFGKIREIETNNLDYNSGYKD